MFSARNCSETEVFTEQADKENQENSENQTPVRTRKLWVDCEPYTPPSQEPAVDSQITLKLTHFAKKPIIDFGVCKIKKEVVRELVIDNTNCYDVDVFVERFPFKKNFNVSKRQFTIDANSHEVLTLTWTPKDPGNYRELGMVNYEGFRLQFLILGTVKENPPKRRRRPLRAMNLQQNTASTINQPKTEIKDMTNRSPCIVKQEFQLGNIVKSQSPQTACLEPVQSSPVEIKTSPNSISPTNKENDDSLQTPPTVKKIPSSSKPDFEYFQFKDHLQQSLGRPTFVVSQTPPSELPAQCRATIHDKLLLEAAEQTTPTGRPTFLVSDTPKSELPQHTEEQGDNVHDFDSLIRSFHERVCRQNSAGDAPENLHKDSTVIVSSSHAADLNYSLHSNTSTATYVVGELTRDSVKAGSKRKSDLCPSPPKKQIKSPKLQTLRRQSKGTPGKSGRRKRGSGTPKGKTLQKLRAGKSGQSTFPSPRKLSYKKSTSVKCEVPTSGNMVSKAAKQPTLAGTKRLSAMQAKKPTKKKIVKGIPMAHLVLKSESNMPQQRHPLTYASKNQFYDAKWRIKQQRALACWANYILTPDEFKPNSEKPVTDVSILASTVKIEPAMSKEAASLRAYQFGCRLNSLRRSACNLFHSTNISTIIRKVEEEVDTARLKVRNDRPLWKDLGCRHKLLSLLMSFHSIWLRLGLEAIFGEMIPISEGQHPTTVLSRFIKQRVLHDEDIAEMFAHRTVPHSFRQGFEDELGKHALKKIFVLIYMLDQAKLARLIDHDPCLFEKGAGITSCKEVLVQIAREFLSGEGDVVKHLSYIGYRVSHQQSYLDEFEYGVNNIAVDMRNGIRLTRMTEILFHEWSLSPKLRIPPGSLLQKRHNIGVAIKALESHGISVKDDEGKIITTEHIVHGNQDKTLSLIWNIAAHFQLVNAVNPQNVEKEIWFLEKTLKLKQHQLGSKPTNLVFEINQDVEVPAVEKTSALLLKWCQHVCAHHDIEVHNFVNSFADGTVLATLISHYQPNLIPPTSVRMETTLHMWDQQPEKASDSQTSRESYLKLTKNEKANFLMVKRAAHELGGIPSLMCIDDFCGTIPDSKVCRLLVAYLCTRLIDVRREEQAARIIQMTWKNFLITKQEREQRKRKTEMGEKAATIINSSVRAWICRKRYLTVKNACQVIQGFYKASKASKTARKDFIAKRTAAIKIQSFVRMFLEKQLAKKLQQELILMRIHNKAATILQKAWRRVCFNRERENAALKIQTWFRFTRQRKRYLHLRRSSCVIQEHWRAYRAGRQQKELYTTLRSTAVFLQSCARRQLALKRYNKFREAVIVIQSHWKGVMQRRKFVTLKSSACVIQVHWRAILAARQCQNYFQLLRLSAITIQGAYRRHLLRKKQQQEIKQHAAVKIQAQWRSYLQRKEFLQTKKCVIMIQACWRGHLQKKNFMELKNAAMLIQAKWKSTLKAKVVRNQFLELRMSVIKMQALRKGTVERRRFLAYKNATVALQTYVRGWLARRRYQILKLDLQQKIQAAICIQSAWKSYKAKTAYVEIRNAAIVIQQHWRATIFMRKQKANFLQIKQSCLRIQSFYRGYVTRRKYCQLKTAALVIQHHWKATILAKNERSRFLQIRKSCILIQAHVRGFLARKSYIIKKKAALVIQEHWRATVLAKEQRTRFLVLKKCCLKLQSYCRGYIARQRLLHKKHAVAILQKHWKATILARKQRAKYQELKRSCLIIQKFYRGYIAKKRYQEIKNAAIILQQQWKAILLSRQQREKFLLIRKACLQIQSFYRCYSSRHKYLRLRSATVVIQQHWKATILARKKRSEFLLIKRYCLKIQSCFRGFVARKDFKRKKNAAIVIQQYWRATVLAKMQRENFLQLKKSCVQIQSHYRGFIAKQRYVAKKNAAIVIQQHWRATILARFERTKYLQTKSACLKIQTYHRGHVARQRYLCIKSAVTVIQQHWNATVLAKVQRNKFLQLKKSCIQIQSYYRGHVARQRFVDKKNAAIVIQQYWRATILARKQRAEFLKMKISCLQIQSYYRGHIVRQQFLRKRKAAIVIQRYWKATILAKKQRENYIQMGKCCLKIQSIYRGYVARQHYHKLTKAAKIIQQHWKATILARKQRDQYLNMKECCLKIQSYYRGFVARQCYLRQRNAVIVIQQHWKATIMMKKQRTEFVKMKESCLQIQSYYRGHIVRQQYLRQRKAVVVIQQHWRATILAKEQSEKYLQLRKCCLKIQSFYKGYAARQHYHKMKNAAIVIQQHWRATTLEREQRDKYLNMKECCLKIQSYYRGFVVRQCYLRQRNAVIVIQQLWKATIMMKKQRTEFVKMKESCLQIQSYYRGHIVRQQYIRKRKAAIVIQRYWKATILAKEQREKYLQLRKCCLKVQSFYRGYVARHRFQKLKKAAIVIQQHWKATILARKQRKEFLCMKRCCLNIQSYYRGHAARQRYQLLKDQAEEKQRNIAATLIQSSWKGHIKRREFFSLKKATITIQAWYRSVKAKQNYLKIKNAVVTIQLKWMATMQARKVQKDFKALKSAVITVQAARRAIVQRRKFLATKNATVTIQSFVKGWLARKQYKAAKLALRKRNKAAVCIQSAWRAFKARQMFIKIRNATVTIQRHWKATVLARKQRSQFLKQKISCLQIQSCYRGYRVRQQFLIYLRQKTEKTQRNNAAIIIQSACKGYQAKQEYLCKKKAAITIQSRYKAFKARQNYLMVRKAVVIIQRKWKATLLANRIRKEFKVLKSSVVKLQAVRRMIVQRRKFLEIKSAAILIQAHFRGWSIRRTYIAKREAAIKIQAYFRRILCQKSYLAKRNAADCMQKRFRAKQLANATRAQFMKQKQSAILIQAFYRGYTARKQFKLMQEKARNEKAAIVLQSWIRGCQQRQAYALLLEKKAAKRKLQLMMIGMAAQDHLNAIIIQRAYRRSVVRAHHKQHMQHVVLVQRTWRAKLMRRKFVKMRKAAVVIQRQYRRHFFHRQQKVILIQRWWRTLMENRKVKQQYKASLKIQAAWRGYKVRKSMLVFPGIAFQRAKLEEATKRASLHPENTIYNRMVLALGILFNKKYLNQVRSALEELERVSGLVGICCVHITDAGGPRELFRLLGVCNRDFGSGSVARLSLRILTNLLSNPPSSEAVKLIMDENIDDIVNVFPKYQDRGGRDKSSRPVFIAACDLLLVYLRDSQRAKDFVENHQLNVQRIKNIQKETERRYKKQNERSSIQRRMTEIHAVGYLNDSTMIAEQSFVKERSFVKGMFVSMASTSTPTRSKAPKLPEATSKQKITSKKPKVKAALVKQPTEATRAHSRPKTAAKAHVAVPAVRKEALKPAESGAGPSRRRSVQPGRSTQAKCDPVAPDLAEKALHKLNMICDIFELYK